MLILLGTLAFIAMPFVPTQHVYRYQDRQERVREAQSEELLELRVLPVRRVLLRFYLHRDPYHCTELRDGGPCRFLACEGSCFSTLLFPGSARACTAIHWRDSPAGLSPTTIRRRRDEWITAGNSPVDRGKQGTKHSLLTDSWHHRGFKKLEVCTERRTRVINALIALASSVIIIRRLISEALITHRWDTRPTRRP